jgi:hypothetical protein
MHEKMERPTVPAEGPLLSDLLRPLVMKVLARIRLFPNLLLSTLSR